MAMKYSAELWHVLEIGVTPPKSEPRWLTHLFQWVKDFLKKRVRATLRDLRDALLQSGVLPNHAPSRQCGALRTLVSLEGLRVVSKVHQDRVKISDEEKRCPTCQRVLPLEHFRRCRANADGHETRCKDCEAAREARRKRGDFHVSGHGAHSGEASQRQLRNESRKRALDMQKRDPRADYFANYRGVKGPLLLGCV